MTNHDPALFSEFAEFKRWREAQVQPTVVSRAVDTASSSVQTDDPTSRIARVRRTVSRRTTRSKAPAASPETIPPPAHMVDILAPRWAYEGASWIAGQDVTWRSAAAVLGSVLLVLGGALLFGSGYTSIQGVRIPLDRMGLPVASETFPPFQWWLIPIANVVVQIFAKHIPRLWVLWRPSVTYDGITNALYLAGWIMTLLASYGQALSIVLLGSLSAVLGLLLAVLAEKLFLAAVCILRAAYLGRR